MSAKKAVVLLSGGLDSTTVLAYAINEGYETHTLSFQYEQRHSSELKAAQKIADASQVRTHSVFHLPLERFETSALTNFSLQLPENRVKNEIPVTYVPARNTIFLSIALGLAEVIGATVIFYGASSVDFSGYPDCRPEYVEAFNHLAQLATKTGQEGVPISVQAPLIYLSKAETILLGIKLGVDYSLTVSCYQADEEGRACGRCDSCAFRKKGFTEAHISDPTLYLKPPKALLV